MEGNGSDKEACRHNVYVSCSSHNAHPELQAHQARQAQQAIQEAQDSQADQVSRDNKSTSRAHHLHHVKNAQAEYQDSQDHQAHQDPQAVMDSQVRQDSVEEAVRRLYMVEAQPAAIDYVLLGLVEAELSSTGRCLGMRISQEDRADMQRAAQAVFKEAVELREDLADQDQPVLQAHQDLQEAQDSREEMDNQGRQAKTDSEALLDQDGKDHQAIQEGRDNLAETEILVVQEDQAKRDHPVHQARPVSQEAQDSQVDPDIPGNQDKMLPTAHALEELALQALLVAVQLATILAVVEEEAQKEAIVEWRSWPNDSPNVY